TPAADASGRRRRTDRGPDRDRRSPRGRGARARLAADPPAGPRLRLRRLPVGAGRRLRGRPRRGPVGRRLRAEHQGPGRPPAPDRAGRADAWDACERGPGRRRDRARGRGRIVRDRGGGVTIRRGEPWGAPGRLPEGAPIARDDQELAELAATADEGTVVGLTGGDLHRTLGAPPPERLTS